MINIIMVLGPYNKSGTKGTKYHNLAFQSDSLRSRLKAAFDLKERDMLMARKVWVYDPQSGGINIPDRIKQRIRQRILDHASKNYSGRFNRIDVKFRGKFCYIDAYTEPFVPAGDYDQDLFGESREEHIARLRNTPTHLCRLRYFGDDDRWSMAFYTYSHETYEPCVFDTGSWEGTPEEAFDTSAVYLVE